MNSKNGFTFMSDLKYIFFLTASFLFIFFSDKIFGNGYDEFLSRGDEFYSKFDLINAIKNYDEAYKLEPDNYQVLLKIVRTYNDIGEDFVEQRKRDEAKKYIDKAVKLSEKFQKKYPDSASVYAYLAFSYGNFALFQGGKEKVELAEKIEQNAKKSLLIDPDQYLSHVILGIYNRQVSNLSWVEKIFANIFFGNLPDGSYKQSIEHFKKALQKVPDMIVATFQMALTYRDMGEDEKAAELFKKVLTLPVKDFRDKYAIRKSKRRLEKLMN